MAEVLIISGAGDYADPWHPFAATSARLAEVITSYGHRVEVSGTVEETLRSLSDRQMPRWPEILGGHWVRGTTMHPPLDEARIRLRPGPHPVAGDAVEIAVLDERYSYLDVRDDVEVLGEHTYEGSRHPMIWAREQGPGRIVYDGLGHDARSYDSPGHLALLGRAVTWLTGERT